MRKKLSNYQMRLEKLKDTYQKFEAYKLKIDLPDSLSESLVFSYDNLQNDPELAFLFKDSFFAAKELVDAIIYKLHKNHKHIIAKDFTKFMIALAKEEYTHLNDPCIKFLEQKYMIHGFIMIRTFRNKMKTNLDLTFHCKNKNELELILEVEIPSKLREGIPNFDEIMRIKNREQVTGNNQPIKMTTLIYPSNLINDLIKVFEQTKEICQM